jgi:hypothetical protein
MEHSQLNELDRAFAECAADCESLVAGAPREHLVRRPKSRAWSVAECIEHLNITGQVFYLRLRREIDALRQESMGNGDKFHASGEYKMEFVAKALRWYLEPPARLKSPTPDTFQPLKSPNPDRVVPAFLVLQSRLRELLADAEGLPLDQRKITSPFASNLHYNLYSALCLLAAHQRRHLWQARRALLAQSR